MAPIKLQGSIVTLVPLAIEHMDALCEIGLDERLWQATTIKVRTREQMAAYICTALDAQLAGTALPFVVVERSTNAIVGTTRLHSADKEHRRIEIGFTWISIPWQRTVVNTESKYLLLRHAFDEMGCNRVEFRVNAENEQSRRALLRIGAKQEGILRSYRVSPSGGSFDLAVYSIIAAEWSQVRSALALKIQSGPA